MALEHALDEVGDNGNDGEREGNYGSPERSEIDREIVAGEVGEGESEEDGCEATASGPFPCLLGAGVGGHFVAAEHLAEEEGTDVAELGRDDEPEDHHETLYFGESWIDARYMGGQFEKAHHESEHERDVDESDEGGFEGGDTFVGIAVGENAEAAGDDSDGDDAGGHALGVGIGESAGVVRCQNHDGPQECSEALEGAAPHLFKQGVELVLGADGEYG